MLVGVGVGGDLSTKKALFRDLQIQVLPQTEFLNFQVFLCDCEKMSKKKLLNKKTKKKKKNLKNKN